MGAVKEFYMTMAERGLVPIKEGTSLPEGVALTTTDYQTRFGETMEVPCITTEQAEAWRTRGGCPAFVPAFLDDFASVAVAPMIRRSAAAAKRTAARVAGEIVAAVASGEEWPEEWYKLDAYADIGEPWAWEVVRLIREELEGTGIRP